MKTPRPLLLSLSGPDCSGKSTQIQRLEEALRADGHRVRVFWFRPGYSPLADRSKALLRKLKPGALPRHDQTQARERSFSRPGVSQAWVAFALFDTLLHYGLWLRTQRRLGTTVICDRYLDDAFLDLRFRFPSLEVERWFSAKALRALCPKPDVSLLLSLEESDVANRMALKPEPFPDPPELRQRRHQAYQELAQRGGYTVIDASASIDEVHTAIMQAVTQQS
jgi:thymidylate kinase